MQMQMQIEQMQMQISRFGNFENKVSFGFIELCQMNSLKDKSKIDSYFFRLICISKIVQVEIEIINLQMFKEYVSSSLFLNKLFCKNIIFSQLIPSILIQSNTN